jgi:dienelactone hydrolase
LSDFPIPDDTGPFLIDTYEVTNQQFKEFVDTGGYEEKSFWDGLVFLDKGHQLAWEEAVRTFTDSTGRPGPATWELGSYPGGQANWPVSGISWYEAVAYSRFRGRDLPTHYHWRRAAMSENLAQAIISMSNFNGEKAAQVGLYTGLGPFGTYDAAGNVREWVWNERGAHRMILGGAWNDPRYMFTSPNSLPPFDRSAANGFRTVRYIDERPTEQQLAAVVPRERDLASLRPLSDDAYAALITQFDYTRKSSRGGEVIASKASSRGWRHDTVLIDSAYVPGGFKIHIFLPADAKPPLQPVILFPGLWSFETGTSSESDPLIEHPFVRDIDFVVRSGRVLIWPVYHGSYERHEDTSGSSRPERVNALRLRIVRWQSDVGEVIDYLEGRPDIAADKIAYLGYSYGSLHAPPILALENRIKAAILIAASLSRCDYESVCNVGSISPGLDPLIDNLHYLPRVQQPTLVLSGEYDSVFPLRMQEALYKHLGTSANDKKHIVFPIEHRLPPRNALMTHGIDWLDSYLGPVN